MSLVWLIGALLGNLCLDMAQIQSVLENGNASDSVWIGVYQSLTLIGSFCWLLWAIFFWIAIFDYQTGGAKSADNKALSPSAMAARNLPDEGIQEGGLLAMWNHLFALVIHIVTAIIHFNVLGR